MKLIKILEVYKNQLIVKGKSTFQPKRINWSYLYRGKIALATTNKITKNEIIERFNVKEDKINIIDGFFPKRAGYDYINDEKEKDDDIKVSLTTKYNIKNKFFIFSWWDSIEKNYEKLVKVFKRLKENWKEVDLVFLWTNIWKNIKTLLIHHKKSL